MSKDKKPTPWQPPDEAQLDQIRNFLKAGAAAQAELDRLAKLPKLERVTAAQREQDPRWNGLSESQGAQLSLLLRAALDHFMPEVAWRYSLVVWSHHSSDVLEAVDYTAASNYEHADGDTVAWLEEFVDAWKREGKGE